MIILLKTLVLAQLALLALAGHETIPEQFDRPDAFMDYLENTDPSRVKLEGFLLWGNLTLQNYTVTDFFDPAFRRQYGLPDPRNKKHKRVIKDEDHPPKYPQRKYSIVDKLLWNTAALTPSPECYTGAKSAMSGNVGGVLLCRDYFLWTMKVDGRCTARRVYPYPIWCEAEYEGVRTRVRAVNSPGAGYIGIYKQIISCDRVAWGLDWLINNCPVATQCFHRKCPLGGVNQPHDVSSIVLYVGNQ